METSLLKLGHIQAGMSIDYMNDPQVEAAFRRVADGVRQAWIAFFARESLVESDLLPGLTPLKEYNPLMGINFNVGVAYEQVWFFSINSH